METSSVVAPPPGTHRPLGDSLLRPDERDGVDEGVRHGCRRVALLAVEVEVLDRARLGLVAVAREEVVVEVLPARAHASDVERVVLLERVPCRLDVVEQDDRNARRDVEAVARVVHREHVHASGWKKIGIHPSAISNASSTDFGPHRREVDRDLAPERARHQLERLAEAGRAGAQYGMS